MAVFIRAASDDSEGNCITSHSFSNSITSIFASIGCSQADHTLDESGDVQRQWLDTFGSYGLELVRTTKRLRGHAIERMNIVIRLRNKVQ